LYVCASLFFILSYVHVAGGLVQSIADALDTHKDARTGLEQNEELNKCLGWGHRGMRQTQSNSEDGALFCVGSEDERMDSSLFYVGLRDTGRWDEPSNM
jgi:hypothetical protein